MEPINNWIIGAICIAAFCVTTIVGIVGVIEFGWLAVPLMLIGECAVTMLIAAAMHDGKDDHDDEAGTDR